MLFRIRDSHHDDDFFKIRCGAFNDKVPEMKHPSEYALADADVSYILQVVHFLRMYENSFGFLYVRFRDVENMIFPLQHDEKDQESLTYHKY